MNAPIRVGIIGIGGYGGSYFDAVRQSGVAEASAVCDVNSNALQKVARDQRIAGSFTDYRELIERGGIDAILISTPHHLHHPMAMYALLHGKHVLCEKPLAIAEEHAAELVETARRRGLVLSCHFNQRQIPQVQRLRRLVAEGNLGRLYHVEARWMARWTSFMVDQRTTWRVDPACSGGGILIGRGSHLIDALLHILGQPPLLAVSATTHERLLRPGIDDFASLRLRLADGTCLQISCSYLAHLPLHAETRRYEVLGARGGASCDWNDQTISQAGSCDLLNGRWQTFEDEESAAVLAGGIVGDFLRAIVEGREPLVTGEEAANVVRVVAAAYRSARTGREVSLAAPV